MLKTAGLADWTYHNNNIFRFKTLVTSKTKMRCAKKRKNKKPIKKYVIIVKTYS